MTAAWNAADTAAVLRVPTPGDDKYSRGVLGVRTGSQMYPGAAVLTVEAAWRTGVGMVRYLGPAEPARAVLAARPETVFVDGRVQAWLIGSGTDADHRTGDETGRLREILAGTAPVVVDAGALDLAAGATAPVIVTPHAGEHDRLRVALGLEVGASQSVEAVKETARRLGATVVRKGAQTVIAEPDGWYVRIEAPTSWLATAGTGDVLAGVIGAVRAGTLDREVKPGAVAAAGVWLHGRAAVLAADALGEAGGPITAMDVAAALPRAVAGVLVSG